jgi:replicative DNA helicase
MAIIRRRTVDNEIESKIITGIIVSTPFARKIIPMLRNEYFTTPYSVIVFEWCKEYYKKYSEAPGKHIQDIYEDNQNTLDETNAELIGMMLKRLSKNYEELENFNVDYLFDQASIYLEGKAIKITAERALAYLDKGRLDKARNEFLNHKKLAKDCSTWVNPLDPKFIKDTYTEEEQGTDNVFTFPGALGKLTGYHKRGWLVSILAPKKRGKSFLLMEMAYRAFLNRKKVIIFSLEMSEKRIAKRFNRRITAEGKHEGEYLYPCFDCYYNQAGTCTKVQRTNKVALLNSEGGKPSFERNMRYRACSICRGTSDYQVATWYEIKKRSKQSMTKTIRKAQGLAKMYGDNIRLKSFPAGTATINDLKVVLDSLEYTEGFIPDIIVIDYADILKPTDSRLIDPRAQSNEVWVAMKGWADQMHCLVVTATQGTRLSINKKNIAQTDYSEDIRKGAHIDLGYGISQTPEEKFESVMRISVLEHRDEDSSELQQALILQQRGLGQVLLDSELVGKINYIEDETGLIEMMKGEKE